MRRTSGHRGRRTIAARVETALVYGLGYSFLGLVALTAVVLAYWLKSAAGIDLFDGHSLLHDLFY